MEINGLRIYQSHSCINTTPFLQRRTFWERIKQLPKNPFINYQYRYLRTPTIIKMGSAIYVHPRIYYKLLKSL